MTVGVYSYQNVFCMSDDMNVRQHLQQFIVCFVVQTAVQLILSDLLWPASAYMQNDSCNGELHYLLVLTGDLLHWRTYAQTAAGDISQVYYYMVQGALVFVILSMTCVTRSEC